MYELTNAQRKVLDMIRAYTKEHGYPPSRLNICTALGFSSPNAAQCHLDALKRKGFIDIDKGVSRGIRLTV